jgi:hypothetical protein
MGKHGDKDIIIRPDRWKSLLEGIPNPCVERFTKAGHFTKSDDLHPFKHKL